jgi:hypothetical protein
MEEVHSQGRELPARWAVHDIARGSDHIRAVSPAAALRMWIPKEANVWSGIFCTPFKLAAQRRANGRFGAGAQQLRPINWLPNNHCERYSTAASCSAGLFF